MVTARCLPLAAADGAGAGEGFARLADESSSAVGATFHALRLSADAGIEGAAKRSDTSIARANEVDRHDESDGHSESLRQRCLSRAKSCGGDFRHQIVRQ